MSKHVSPTNVGRTATPKAVAKVNDEQLQAIDPTALNAVTGGAVTSGSGSSDALTQALSTIVQSLQQLQHNQSQSGFGNPATMMMFMMLMQQRNQPTAVAAAPAPYGWPQLPVGYY